MHADASKRPVGGPLQPLHLGIVLARSAEHFLHVLHLEAEVVEASLAASLAGVDVEADVAVGDRHGGVRPAFFERAQAEQRFIELAFDGVVVTDDGDVLQLGGHCGDNPTARQCGRPR